MPYTYGSPLTPPFVESSQDEPWRKKKTNPYSTIEDDVAYQPPSIGEVDAPPEMARAPQSQQPSYVEQAKTSEATAEADRDLAAYRQAVADRPTLQYKKGALGVLQRVGDAFLNPAITHPKYMQEVGQYQQRAKALGEVAGISEAQAKNARGQAESEARLGVAQKQGDYYSKQAAKLNQPEPDEWTYNAQLGKFTNKRGETRDAPPPIQKPTAEKSPTGEAFIYDRMRRLEELKAKGVRTPDEQIEMNSIQQFLQKREAEERAKNAAADRAARGPAAPGDAPQNAFRVIEQKKQDALLKAEMGLQKMLGDLEGDLSLNDQQKEQRKQQILSRHEQTKGLIQNAYLSEIEASKRGGAPGPVTGPGQPAPQKAVKPAAPAAPQAPAGGTAPRRPVSLANPKTGEIRQFNLSDEELQDAKRQGFQPVG